ncbi:nuclear transport factor 2 family protein [Qipengyuania sp. ASV99]|uniref:nuclear transport factor 2 family protein n=1 Tax=Qipengyuania sp. ASV99 TaxID=3399681 RepID=UPI003A4C6EFE
MVEPLSELDMRRLADRLAIDEVFARYCRGIDRCDPDELARVFTKDARIDYGDGPKPRDETITGLMAGLSAMRLTQHNIGNVICEIAGQRARAETYCVALHILPGNEPSGGSGEIEMVVGGRYLDTLEKRTGKWRIAERLYVMDWNRQGPATMNEVGGLYDTLARRGSRAPDDPSCAWWAKAL